METMPDLREELNYKLVEALALLASNFESGAMDPSEAKTTLDVLFSVVSGLADTENVEIMSRLSKMTERTQHRRSQLWFNDACGQTTLIETDPKRFEIRVVTMNLGKPPQIRTKSFVDTLDPKKNFDKALNIIEIHLARQGLKLVE